MQKIRKGDTAQAMKGKDKGKKGRVLAVYPGIHKLLVEGVNMFKKHKRKTQQDQQGGIISVERPLSISNVMVVCKGCSRPVKVGFSLSGDTKTRVCRSCKEVL